LSQFPKKLVRRKPRNFLEIETKAGKACKVQVQAFFVFAELHERAAENRKTERHRHKKG
jgi:hypothetical protein